VTPDLENRLVLSFEQIARALNGLNETYKRHFAKQYPDRPFREAVVTRIPTEEDKIREAHGAGGGSRIEDWLSELDEEERQEREGDIGVREREWLDAQEHHAGSKDKS
jgi:hypothetical protein